MARMATRRWTDKTRMISGMAVLVYCVPHSVVIVTMNRKADSLLGNVIGLMNSSVSILSPLELFVCVLAYLFVFLSDFGSLKRQNNDFTIAYSIVGLVMLILL